jgi:hypothetical protein
MHSDKQAHGGFAGDGLDRIGRRKAGGHTSYDGESSSVSSRGDMGEYLGGGMRRIPPTYAAATANSPYPHHTPTNQPLHSSGEGLMTDMIWHVVRDDNIMSMIHIHDPYSCRPAGRMNGGWR